MHPCCVKVPSVKLDCTATIKKKLNRGPLLATDLQNQRSLMHTHPILTTNRIYARIRHPDHISCTWRIFIGPGYVGAVIIYNAHLTTLLPICAPFRPNLLGSKHFTMRSCNEELHLCHTWCRSPVFTVPVTQTLFDHEPASTWWARNCLFGT